ncbi:neuroglian [Aplysia californica]|uniref:Neuroglian n=1 Tax=Aplysia californica TaxID=6500 RepID=A0ABM0JNT4_APLCA|nr:neuroglian [Aplysia californica]
MPAKMLGLVSSCCCLMVMWLAVAAQQNTLRPPQIIKPERPDTLYYTQGSRVVIECKADGFPTPTYKWYNVSNLSTGEMSLVQPVVRFMSFDSTSGDLIFDNFLKNFEGMYMCVATSVSDTQQGRREAANFSPVLNVLAMRVTNFLNVGQPDKTHSGPEYSYMKIECSDKGDVVGESIAYGWYLDKSSDGGSSQRQIGTDNGRIYIDVEGNLHISYLNISDSTADRGSYFCGIGLTELNLIRLGNGNKLTVSPVNNPVAVAPKRAYSNSGVRVQLYRKAVLECVFDGYDPRPPHLPQISWQDSSYRDIVPGGRYQISADGRRLEINNVQEEDEGDYHCMASNGAGASPKEAVTLDVTSPPIWNEGGQPADMTRPNGRNVTFNCNARSALGEPEPRTPIWFINGKRTGPHLPTTKIQISGDKKQLKVLSVNKENDIMCVQCVVSNDVGTTLGRGCLTVILPIDITYQPKLRQVITYGQSVDLTVRATTDPSAGKLQYEWYFRNATYSDAPPFVYYNPTTMTAFINTSTLTEEEYKEIGGVYRRRIWHENDEAWVDIEVELEDKPAAAVVSSAGFDMWIIGLIIGIIFLIIVIIIIIFIICRKQQEGDYNVDKKETGAGLDPEKELQQKGFDDYSRPDFRDYGDYEYPDRKPRGDLEYDDVPIGGDEDSLQEYGDDESTYFNEDGSFIGVYQQNNKPKPTHATESTI